MPPEKHRRNTEMPSRQQDGIFFALSPQIQHRADVFINRTALRSCAERRENDYL